MKTTVRARRAGLPVVAVAALLAATNNAAAAEPAPPDSPRADQSAPRAGAAQWQESPGDPAAAAAGVRARGGVLSLATDRSARTWTPSGVDGYYTFPARRLAGPVNRVSATVTAERPAGSAVEVEVRGVGPAGRWSEWQPVTADRPAVAPFATSRVQVRVVLTRGSAGVAGPTVSGVALSADVAPAGTAAPAAPAAPAPTYRVFATREGLVGRTTANGHVIRPNDRFVALPSRRALNANDQTRDYKVRVCNPRNGRCVEEPVFDVGPWNTRDDYWNPSNVRESWRNLPQGKPEATAAYYQGYNNGRDQYGRQVANPSGIDLADGTWAAIGMTGNDVVDVTYLWKAS